MRTKVVEKFQNVKTRAQLAAVAASNAALVAMPTLVKAADENIGTGKSASNIVGNIAGVIVKIFPFVGIFFVLAGVFKLIMAYRNDQPEQQASAARDIVIGAVFIVFKVFVWNAIADSVGMGNFK